MIKWKVEEESAREAGLRKARVEELAFEIGILVREHLRRGPHRRETVYEALNALAIHAATILAGADQDTEAMQFFINSLNEQQAFMARGGLGHEVGAPIQSAPMGPVGHSHDGPGQPPHTH